jgi:CRP-like cAMP-binding protein
VRLPGGWATAGTTRTTLGCHSMHIERGDLELIARLPLFAGLDQRCLRPLLAQATVRRFERDAILFLQDEPATRFYVVLDGWVRLYRETAEGQESTIGVFARGESFAEAAIFQSGVFPVNAVAVDDARLLIIQAEPFVRQLRADPDLCLNMMASMSLHLRRLVRQIEHLTVRSSAERLADFLLRLASADQSPTIELPWDKALVAARLGMQPETLSRALAKLRRLGVETRGSRITIGDFDALRRFTIGLHQPVALRQERRATPE